MLTIIIVTDDKEGDYVDYCPDCMSRVINYLLKQLSFEEAKELLRWR